jgi:transcriptional regulator with XRE-family HTH domain
MARPHRAPFESRIAEHRKRLGLTQEQVGEYVGITGDAVRRHERGDHLPIELYRKRYRELFKATDVDLGFRTVPLPTPSPENTQRVESPEPDDEYLASVRTHIGELVALDNRFGGADLVRLSTRFFRGLHAHIKSGEYDVRLERDLHAAAGELSEVAGWLAYDAEEHELTRQMNSASLHYTRLSGDRVTELLTIQNASMHAAVQGNPQEALNLALSVLEGPGRLSRRLQALFLTRKARALAQLGDESALKIFPQIYALYNDGARDSDPAWAWWVDERELLWHEAMAQRDLGMAEAATQFERSLVAVPANEMRSRYVHGSHLLQSQLENGSWKSAEATIAELVPLSRDVMSIRAELLLRKSLGTLNSADRKIPPALLAQAAELRTTLDFTEGEWN